MNQVDRIIPKTDDQTRSVVYTAGDFLFARQIAARLRSFGLMVETPLPGLWDNGKQGKIFGYVIQVHVACESVTEKLKPQNA